MNVLDFIKQSFSKITFASLFPPSGVRNLYHFSFKDIKPAPCVIYTLDGRISKAGLADFLRGMVSAYAFAKARKMPFYIDFDYPFTLSSYLQPNMVNWIMKPDLRRNNWLYATPIWIMNHTKAKLFHYHLPKNRQYHIYTNVNFIEEINNHYSCNYNYANLYEELFVPADFLRTAVSDLSSNLGSEYVSISFRFTTLLGDCEDCVNTPLPENEREIYISKCKTILNQLHDRFPQYRILVTSDSQTFINSITGIPWVFFVPGGIGHLGYQHSNAVLYKLFIDYLLIAGAKSVFLGRFGKMYKSKFASSAALSTGVPFEEIVVR